MVVFDDLVQGGYIICMYGQFEKGVYVVILLIVQWVYFRYELLLFELDKIWVYCVWFVFQDILLCVVDWVVLFGSVVLGVKVEDLMFVDNVEEFEVEVEIKVIVQDLDMFEGKLLELLFMVVEQFEKVFLDDVFFNDWMIVGELIKFKW